MPLATLHRMEPSGQACEQNPAAVRRWLRQDYAAVAQAEVADSVIFWADATGPRSDDVRGRTPVIRVNHRRAVLGGEQQGRVALDDAGRCDQGGDPACGRHHPNVSGAAGFSLFVVMMLLGCRRWQACPL